MLLLIYDHLGVRYFDAQYFILKVEGMVVQNLINFDLQAVHLSHLSPSTMFETLQVADCYFAIVSELLRRQVCRHIDNKWVGRLGEAIFYFVKQVMKQNQTITIYEQFDGFLGALFLKPSWCFGSDKN